MTVFALDVPTVSHLFEWPAFGAGINKMVIVMVLAALCVFVLFGMAASKKARWAASRASAFPETGAADWRTAGHCGGRISAMRLWLTRLAGYGQRGVNAARRRQRPSALRIRSSASAAVRAPACLPRITPWASTA